MSDLTNTPRLSTLTALCCECGATRTASARYLRDTRPLRCVHCGRTTSHAAVQPTGQPDWREAANRDREGACDPGTDLRRLFPDWRVHIVDLDDRHDHLVLWGAKVVYVDAATYAPIPDLFLAHVLAHLLQGPKKLDAASCRDATAQARAMLGQARGSE